MGNDTNNTRKFSSNQRKAAPLPPELIWLIERARQIVGDRILRLPKLCDKIGRAPATVWGDVRKLTFPPPVRLGPRAVGWRESEVDAWLEARSFATRCTDNPLDIKLFVAELIALKGNTPPVVSSPSLAAARQQQMLSVFPPSVACKDAEVDQ